MDGESNLVTGRDTSSSCQHEDWEHEALLEEVSVVIFTLRQPEQLIRLVNSLGRSAVRVKVYDNGHELVDAPDFEHATRVSYQAEPGPWPTMIELAASDLDTEFACVVDDDAMLNLNALARAVCVLKRHPEWSSVECVTADLVVKDDVAFVHYAYAPSVSSVQDDTDGMSRFVASMEHHTEAPFYGVHRSSSLSVALSTKAKVQAAARSTRNASTPIMLGMLCVQGRIGRSPLVLTVRELRHAPIDQNAMDLWFGDWYFGAAYQGEVDEVRKIVASAIQQLGLDDRDCLRAQATLDHFAAVHRHQPGHEQSLLGRIRRWFHRLTVRDRESEPTSGPDYLPARVVIGADASSDYETAQVPCWDSHDLFMLMEALDVSGAKVAARPRDMPSAT